MSYEATRLHFPEGWIERGGKVRACCHCGWATTPRVDRKRARAALDTEHGWTSRMQDVDGRWIELACGICGHKGDWSIDYPWDLMRPLVDGSREIYVCRDDKACHERYEANRRADRLGCGCYQSSVMAIGHYHRTDDRRPRLIPL